MTPSEGEFDYIDWLRSRTPTDTRVLIGPGDDAAAIRLRSDNPCLVTTDMLMDGTCFCLSELGESGPRAVGRKALAVNLSDIAAMAGRPVAAVAAVALPRQGGRRLAEELYLGFREMADEFQTSLVGGDTNSWNGPLVISVTVLGEITGARPVLRSGARPGDWLLVTGPLGGSLGDGVRGKHLNFKPRVHEAIQLHSVVHLHAMIDISDGLAADVNHICVESGCGAVLHADRIPISDDAKLIHDDKSPLDHALSDGEDFELVFAVSEEDARRLLQTQPIAGMSLVQIGQCIEKGLWIEEAGKKQPLAPRGYEHDLS